MPEFPIPESWSFDDRGVAEGFDAHVREQLPWYDLVTDAVVAIARHYIPDDGHVYDIGAATGNVGRALDPILLDRGATLVAIEPAYEIAQKWHGPGRLVIQRAEEHDFDAYDFGVAMLALMFVPPYALDGLLSTLVNRLRPGGALVVVERMLPPNGYPSIVSSRLTLAAKLKAGSEPLRIIEKELSLAGVQRPLDPAALAFYGATEFFRYGDFAGYLIEAR